MADGEKKVSKKSGFGTKVRAFARSRAVRIVLICGALLAPAAAALLLWADHQVEKAAAYVHTQVGEVPAREYGLLLGTARIVRGGYLNEYFLRRIRAAVQLYKAGKVKKIIVSGDNRRREYNEPQDMKDALMAEGIPEAAILMDFAGFRTLDSVVRARNVFGVRTFTVISQQFHCARAVYLARANGLDAVGFAAEEVPARFRFKNAFREPLARAKAFLDLHLLGTRPHFEK
ncbi:MAG: YdcF family protein [Lentisphaeria bacterium]|nr:YdcF family protein [Lentisphaeria bacterium]